MILLVAEDDVPEDLDNLAILTPEEFEVLAKAREEQGHDLSRDQWEGLLRAMRERPQDFE